MDVVRFVDALLYSASNHEDVVARRLQGGEASPADFVVVGHSSFPAGAVIPMEAGPVGKIYVVVDGMLVIEQKDGIRHLLQQWDSIFISSGEARAVRNESGASAAIIVITPIAST